MATETQIEVARDPSGLVTRTVTKQAFDWEDPASDCRSYRVTQTDGVTTIVEEHFDEMPTIYNVDISTTQEPMESHPFFTNIAPIDRQYWAWWKQNPQNPQLGGWSPSDAGVDPLLVDLYNYWKLGVYFYLAPRIVIKSVALEDSAPNVSGVGHLAETGYPGDVGSVDFILSGVSAQQEGTKWRVTREYLSSAIGSNWDASIYGGSN